MNRLTPPRCTLMASAALAALASTAAPPIRSNNLFTEDGAYGYNLAQRNDLPDGGGAMSTVIDKANFKPELNDHKLFAAGANCIDRADLPAGALMAEPILLGDKANFDGAMVATTDVDPTSVAGLGATNTAAG